MDMRRIARLFGILGGIGAVIWAMRDRFVKVAIPREPQPPAFKAPSRIETPGAARTTGETTRGYPETATTSSSAPESPAPTGPGEPDLTEVNGIGPVYAARLSEAGIDTIPALASSRPEKVAAAAEVPLSRAVGWIDAAKSLA